jgi:hypothetical protein
VDVHSQRIISARLSAAAEFDAASQRPRVEQLAAGFSAVVARPDYIAEEAFDETDFLK